MIELMSIVALVIPLFFVSLLIDEYNEIIFEKYRFRYFALRDRLALLVVKGDLEEDSWEFEKIVDTINFHIGAVEAMSIERIVTLLIEHHTSPEEERKVRIINNRISNIEVRAIMEEFMSITSSLLYRNSRVQIKFVTLISKLFGEGSVKRIKTPKLALQKIQDRKDALAKAA